MKLNKIYIFRHFTNFNFISADSLSMAKTILYIRRKKSFYYYRLVNIVDTLKEAKKFRKETIGKGYINSSNMSFVPISENTLK